MKLDTRAIRYLTSEDWRVLAAVEQGSKNHEVVPTPLIQQIAGLRGGSGVHKCISNLAKVGLIGKVKNARYDGYRLTYGGLDYLALNTHRKASTIFSLGNQIGVGKESDIYITASPDGSLQVMKIHRLGRISFRSVKSKRDYLRNRSTGSWMYLSRLAAQKEFEIMKVLHREQFVVPRPVSWSRHTVVMEFIDAFPLRMIESVPEPGELYAELMDMIVQLAKRGLVHGDFNEFNLLIKERTSNDGKVTISPVLIDFPQAVSTNHLNAQMYFDRDVACIKRYFERKFKYVSDAAGPFLQDALQDMDPAKRLDIEVEASGFSKKMARELESYVEAAGDHDTDGALENDYEDDAEGTDDDNVDHDVENNGQGNSDDQAERLGHTPVHEVAFADPSGALSTEDDASANRSSATAFGLMPLELSSGSGVVVDKIHKQKAAAGWAI